MNLEHRLLPFVCIAVATLNSEAALSQTSVNCNGLMEQAGNGPGVVGEIFKDDCVQININGNLITPAQCVKIYTTFDIQQHTCVQGVSTTYCKWNALKVNISKYTNGGCPQVPDLDGIDWGSIDGWLGAIPRIIKSLGCQRPIKENEQSDSAKQEECTPNGGVDPNPGEVRSITDAGTAIWLGVELGISDGPAGLTNPFQTPYEAAQTATPSLFGGLLGAVAETQTGLLGVNFHASLVVERFETDSPEEPVHSREITYWGQMCTDGRFDVHTIMPATYEGKATSSNLHATFDGHNLRTYFSEAGSGNRFTLSGAPSRFTADAYMEGLREIYGWCVDPFEIPLFPGISYTESQGSTSDTRSVTRSHPLIGGGSFVSEEYTLSTRVNPAIPVSRSEYDTSGFAWNTCDYDGFIKFRENDLRPKVTKWTHFYGAGENLKRTVVTLRIDMAKPLTAETSLLVPAPHSTDIKWVEWTQ